MPLLWFLSCNIESFSFPLNVFQCEKIDPVDVTAVAKTSKRALAICGSPAMKEMVKNCMAQDLSWKVSTVMIS